MIPREREKQAYPTDRKASQDSMKRLSVELRDDTKQKVARLEPFREADLQSIKAELRKEGIKSKARSQQKAFAELQNAVMLS